MKEMNDIENLFGSTFGDEQVVPPTEVKSNIDSALFGTKKFGFLRLLPLILLFAVSSTIAVVWYAGERDDAENSKLLAANPADNESNSKGEETLLSQDQQSAIKSVVEEHNGEESEGGAGLQEKVEVKGNSRDSGFQNFQSNNANKEQKVNSIKLNSTSGIVNDKVGSTNSNVKGASANKNSEELAKNEKFDILYSGFEKDETNELGLFDLSNTSNNSNLDVINENVDVNIAEETDNNGIEITANLRTKSLTTIVSQEEDALPLAYLPRTNNDNFSVWDISIYAGFLQGTGAINVINQTYAAKNSKISETKGFNFSAEIGYQFNRSLSLVSGLEYHSTNSEVYAALSSDSILVDAYIQLVYNDPVLMDSVIDTLFIEEYEPVISPNYGVGIKTIALSLPIYMRYTKHFGPKWDLAISAGVRMSYLKQTFNYEDPNSTSPALKSFNVALALRPELIYKFGQFGIGAYGKFGMDVMKRLEWTDMKRQRYDMGGGIVLRYYF